MSTVTHYKALALEELTYGEVRQLDKGARSVFINYNKKPLLLQTPPMKCVFGVKCWPSAPGADEGNEKATMELAFSAREDDVFLAKAKAFDAKIVQDCLEKSGMWLKGKYNSADVVRALYTPLVRYPKDKFTGEVSNKYPPTIRLALPRHNGSIVCDAYDLNKQPLDINTVELKGAQVTAIIQCLGVWIAAGKFGVSWKVVQLRVKPSERITGFAFHAEEGEADQEEEVVAPAAVVTDTYIETSSEEEDTDSDSDSEANADDVKDVHIGVAKKRRA